MKTKTKTNEQLRRDNKRLTEAVRNLQQSHDKLHVMRLRLLDRFHRLDRMVASAYEAKKDFVLWKKSWPKPVSMLDYLNVPDEQEAQP